MKKMLENHAQTVADELPGNRKRRDDIHMDLIKLNNRDCLLEKLERK